MIRATVEACIGFTFIGLWVIIAICCFSRIFLLLDDRHHPLASPLYLVKILIVFLLGASALGWAVLGELDFIFPDETWRLVQAYAHHIVVLHILRPWAVVLFCVVVSTPAVLQVPCSGKERKGAKRELPLEPKRRKYSAVGTFPSLENDFHVTHRHRELVVHRSGEENNVVEPIDAEMSCKTPPMVAIDAHHLHSIPTITSNSISGDVGGDDKANQLEPPLFSGIDVKQRTGEHDAYCSLIDSERNVVALGVTETSEKWMMKENYKISSDVGPRSGPCALLLNWVTGRPLTNDTVSNDAYNVLVEKWSQHLLWRVTLRLRLLFVVWFILLVLSVCFVIFAMEKEIHVCYERNSELEVCKIPALETSPPRLYLPRTLDVLTLMSNVALLSLWVAAGMECLSRIGNLATKLSFLKTYFIGTSLLALQILYESSQLFDEIRYNGLVTVVLLFFKNVSEAAFVMLLAMRLGSGSRKMPRWYVMLGCIMTCNGRPPSV